MGTVKITQKATASSVKNDANVLITQPETVNGESVESLRRAQIGTFAEKIGALLISTDISTDASSDTKAASPKSVKTYADSMTAYKTASIPMGSLDVTSTSTVMTAQVAGITELRDGVCVWLRNGVVTSADGYTININSLGAKPVYSSMASVTRTSTIFNINYTALLIYNSSRVTGGCWDFVYGYDSNTTYTPPALGFCYVNSNTSSSPSATIIGTNNNYVQPSAGGGIVCVNFKCDCAAGATLNISNKGEAPIWYRGAAITAGVIKNGDVATFVYYPTRYYLISVDRWGKDISEITVPDISTDISTDASSDVKTASPKAVKTYVDAAIGTAIGGSY